MHLAMAQEDIASSCPSTGNPEEFLNGNVVQALQWTVQGRGRVTILGGVQEMTGPDI